MGKIKYQIYPSLLDAYSRFKRNDDEETLNSLLDRINKVETERPEHVLKGIDFEECVNSAIDSLRNGKKDEIPYDILTGMLHSVFDADVVIDAAHKLQNATKKQEYIEAVVETQVGLVKLYGIIDYRFPDMIADLKGRELYNYGDYSDHAQHPCYSLISKTNGTPIKAFKYVISDYKNVFVETYIPNDNDESKFLRLVVEFCQFIEHMKKFITNKKIFGEKETDVTDPS